MATSYVKAPYRGSVADGDVLIVYGLIGAVVRVALSPAAGSTALSTSSSEVQDVLTDTSALWVAHGDSPVSAAFEDVYYGPITGIRIAPSGGACTVEVLQ